MIAEQEEPSITGKIKYMITETVAMTEELCVIIAAADLVILVGTGKPKVRENHTHKK